METGNVIDLKTNHEVFKTPGIRFSVSSRMIRADMDVAAYIKIFYMYTDFASIESVFGNTVFPSRLYGGRSYQTVRSLTERHTGQLNEMGIGLALTLTNHFFDEDAYGHSREFLKEHHKKGNSIICTNDQLAQRIRDDFPCYTLKASITKHTDTVEKVERALELYDFVVPPMDKNDDDDFLNGIKAKEKIILFGNANCAYNCPDRSCYLGFSQRIAGKPVTASCSRKRRERLDLGSVFFNIRKFKEMGYRYFKLVPLAPPSAVNAALYFSPEAAHG